MPHKTTARLQKLLDELHKAQRESVHLLQQARRDVADVIGSNGLRPAGTSGTRSRKKKAGRKQKR